MSDDKSPEKLVITNRKTVWVAYTNTDCTEGRGYDIPIAACELEVTARRLARGRHVQGSDGPVRPVDRSPSSSSMFAWQCPGSILSRSRQSRQPHRFPLRAALPARLLTVSSSLPVRPTRAAFSAWSLATATGHARLLPMTAAPRAIRLPASAMSMEPISSPIRAQ